MEEENTIKILHVEDNHFDARLIKEMLSQSMSAHFELEHFEQIDAASERLKQGGIDVILSDLNVTDSQGLNTFKRLHEQAPNVPILLITGSYEEVEIAIEAMRMGAQDYIGKDIVSSDILVRSIHYAIERKHLENAVIEAAEVKSRFISVVSHDIRTLLTSLKESICVVLDGITGKVNKEQAKILTISKNSIDRLSRLASNVLDFQKLEAGKMEFDMQENDINALVTEVHQTVLHLAGSKNLNLALNLASEAPRALFDRDKIIQVLSNLVGNAIKFTEKGTITITTQKAENAVQVAVSDTGPGIKKDDIPKLFGEFVQLSSDSQEIGTGLGLAICKDIVELHHGKIWAESEPGRGTTFYFTLPILK